MLFTFETTGNNTFLVYKIGPEDVLDTMTLGMITNNRIPGLAPALYTQMDTERFLKYNVTSRVSARQFLAGTVTRRRLLGIFSGIAGALSAAGEYMIDQSALVMDMDWIYADVTTCGAELICLPVIRETEPVDAGLFFKNIMFTTQFDQTENCDYVARIISFLNSTPVFGAEDFGRLLEELKEGAGKFQPSAGETGRLQHPAGETGRGAASKVRDLPEGPGMPEIRPAPRQDFWSVRQAVQTPVDQGMRSSADQGGQNRQRPASPTSAEGAGRVSAEAFARSMPQADPAGQTAGRTGRPEEPASGETQAKMSVLYLLQHYNKENVAAYKAQKQAKKLAGKAEANTGIGKEPDGGLGFAVPGQPFVKPWENPAAASSQASPDARPAPQRTATAQQMTAVQQMAVPRQTAAVQQTTTAQQTAAQQMTASSQAAARTREDLSQAGNAGDNFGDTVMAYTNAFQEDTVTEIGTEKSAPHFYLLRYSNGEKIPLTKAVFRIGKEKGYVDYCISGDATISRSHADIVRKEDEFFVVDNNSKNHTYVDGKMIPSNTEVPLTNGTRLRFSGEEFEFRCF